MSQISRRELLKGSGALIVTFGLAPAESFAQAVATLVGNPSKEVDGWLAIAADGSVTAYTGKCELGQGLYTAQTQLVAEELCVPIERVKLIQCQTSVTPDQGVTSGAQSHPQNFNHMNLALAAATGREALLQMAARHLGAPVEQLTVRDGVVSHQARKVAYGELIGGRKFNLPLSGTAKRRHPRDWTVLGTPVKRLDMPAMATGHLEYAHNVRVPGMAHGRVVRPPTVGATLVAVDEASVRDIPGFLRVVVKNNFVGVVCEKQWQAVQAASRLKATWKPGPGLPAQATFHDYMRTRPSRDTLLVDSKDIEAKLASAATVVRATYLHPYHMHASIGASCAVADVKKDGATIWSPTQGVYPQRDSCAMLLGMPRESVKVNFARGSGCYGINGADTVSYDAALLSQAVGRPVRVQLTRKDEMAWENFGLAFVIDQRVGLDRDGNILAWDYEAWSPVRGGRPGYNQPGNQVTGFLAGFEPAAFAPRSPAPAPSGVLANGQNVVPSYVTGCIGTACSGTGTVKSERMLSRSVESPFWTGPLRSPARLQNTFAHECLMDEVAAAAKADPVEYRLRHLRDPRLMAVVRAAAKAANWEPRTRTQNPEPRTQDAVRSGRGIACVLYEGDNGYCSMVAEVDVNIATGVVTVKRLVMALDVGPISNPDGVRNQAEGGALHGMSRALFEEVTWDAEKVTSVDWRTYRTLPVGSNIPQLETVLINTMDAEANGAGETSITVTAAAIGNAIFDACGARLRQVPFTPERVKAALK
ncbi:MAG: molybdopterin-dependent oxidoreductase [Vicinamibacterales bacterium]|nr:molybdopterin-dependent oxidoreductase [Vicinamibacterales bacterium]